MRLSTTKGALRGALFVVLAFVFVCFGIAPNLSQFFLKTCL